MTTALYMWEATGSHRRISRLYTSSSPPPPLSSRQGKEEKIEEKLDRGER